MYERLADRHMLERFTLEEHSRAGLADVRVEPGVDGPIFSSVVVTGIAPEGSAVRLEIRLFRHTKRIQVQCRIVKHAVTEPEALYVAFPFGLTDGEVSYEAQGGVVVPGRDQLPGSASDWNTVQAFARVQSMDAEIVITSNEAPLWQFGDINLGKFRYIAEVAKPHLYSWVMNNYWVTNFRASQEGEFRWGYDLTSGRPAPASEATHFGRGARVGLVPRVLPPAREERGEGTFSLLSEDLPANVHLVSLRPSEDGRALFLHLREVDGRETTLDPRRHFPGTAGVRRTDVVGTPLEDLPGAVTIAPLGVSFLRLDLEGR